MNSFGSGKMNGEPVSRPEDLKAAAKPVRGTAEWAVATVDCCLGCPHGCRYCYARNDQVERQGLLTAEEWTIGQVDPAAVTREQPLYRGQVMFPAHHDIVPGNLAACRDVLLKLLAAGNQVLVVSKPHLPCIEELCRDLAPYREKLLFRFTITARNREILQFWEPGAPLYEERLACLELAFRLGFATSVSVEPMLDTDDVVAMVAELQPLVSHSIWLGRMNRISERVHCADPDTAREISRVERGQNEEHIWLIYQQLRGIPQIRWKESIKTVVGLELAAEAGLDI